LHSLSLMRSVFGSKCANKFIAQAAAAARRQV
jgi:hypothetical protein